LSWPAFSRSQVSATVDARDVIESESVRAPGALNVTGLVDPSACAAIHAGHAQANAAPQARVHIA